MDRNEFGNLRTGDLVYPTNGLLRGQVFEVIDICGEEVMAILLEDYVKEQKIDEHTKIISTYNYGYSKSMSYKNWSVRNYFY